MNNLFNHAYPYLDEHELNLDWLIAKMKELNIAFDEFKVVNNITFSGQWDITKQYPAWTIVSDNNIGYVSIQPVPVGVPLTNGSYWVEVIDYTAQIAGLETRVIDLEHRCDDFDTDIASINNNINEINDFIHELNIITISDSYGNQLNSNNKRWFEVMADNLGIPADKHIDSYVSGSGFTDTNSPDTFQVQLQNIVGGMTSAERDAITDIVVIGGCNDHTAATLTLLSAIESFCNYAKTNFKNAIIRIGHVGRVWTEGTISNMAGTSIPCYAKCCNYGASYIKGSENIMHQFSLFYSDKIHPNAAGVDEIGNRMSEALLSGYVNVIKRIAISLGSPYSAMIDTITLSGPFVQTEMDNMISFNFLQNGGSITINYTSETVHDYYGNLADMNDSLISGSNANNAGFCLAKAFIYNNSNVLTETRDCILKVVSDKTLYYQTFPAGGIPNSKKMVIQPMLPWTCLSMLC